MSGHAGILHRDIKSANVLASIRHGRRLAKLADLGSARAALELAPGDDMVAEGAGAPAGDADAAGTNADATNRCRTHDYDDHNPCSYG